MDHISLSDLNEIIGKALADHLLPSYWVVAEIGDLKVNQKGHCYLELVEKDGDVIKSKMRGTIWSFTHRKLSAWFEKFTGQPLQAGLKILFNATIQYHPVYGLSLNVRDIDAQYTLGERAKRRIEVINRLKEEGVFDMNREAPLPLAPQHIAVISSPTAAGWEDFNNHIGSNEYGYDLIADLYPAVMQGAEASQSIIEAILQIFEKIEQYDILVIIRGGGASLDLDCFDSYELASHIAQFPIPVITGIGHERDETVTDLVAHTQLKTPTAVAEFLISGMKAFEEKLLLALDRMMGFIDQFRSSENYRLERLARQLFQAHANETGKQVSHLDRLGQRLSHGIDLQTEKKTNWLNNAATRLYQGTHGFIGRHLVILDGHEKSIEYLNPEEVMRRGYTITLIGGKLIKDVEQVKKGDAIQTIDTSRKIDSHVTDIKIKGK